MLIPHPDVDPTDLADLLVRQYGKPEERPAFVPVGGDSWCYRADPYFVSVRRDRQRQVPEAYEAAAELHGKGLEFILAPLRGGNGRVVQTVNDLSVIVLPLVEGEPLRPDLPPDHATVTAAVAMIGSLHSQTVSVTLPVEDFRFGFQGELETALHRARDATSRLGPFGQAVHQLFAEQRPRIESWLDEAAEISAMCSREFAGGVLTHGEATNNNLFRRGDAVLLLDWGDMISGPPERDWQPIQEWSGQAVPGARSEFLRFYRLRWLLGELSEYTDRLTRPHEGDAEDFRAWDLLRNMVLV